MVEDDEFELICSAKGCRAPAAHQLRWNNPKLHAADARKTWLACTDHRHWLGEFLSVRGFLREVLPVRRLRPDAAGGAGTDPDGADALRP